MMRPSSLLPLIAALLLGAPAHAGPPQVPISHETIDIPSQAQPPNTPGTPGVEVVNSRLITQLGDEIDLNRARYTRFFRDLPDGARGSAAPDMVLILVPGFEGGASNFAILAENLIRRTFLEHGLTLEVWAFDRRSNQLEDLVGLDIAEDLLDPVVGIDWLFGAELGLELDPALVAGPNRRAFFYNATTDIPFLANWTPLVFSQDIDAVVEAARARTDAVFLGGHSAGTGFTARYAATDFDLTGQGPPQPGYGKLRGLVLLEGGGGSSGDPPSAEELDLIEARFDGGLFGAVRDGEPRCIDGETACTVDTEQVDCAAFENSRCVESVPAYAVIPLLLNPRILATLEVLGIQMASGDNDSGIAIVARDFGEKGNSPANVVPDLMSVTALPLATAEGAVGTFVDDDGPIAGIAPFLAMSIGFTGPEVDGLVTWLDLDEKLPPEAFADNGPAPTEANAGRWGVEVESSRFDRLRHAFYRGGTNFTDWYYPLSGLFVSAGLGLDSSALSLDPPAGRGRRDIENLTQAAAIDIPVIGLGGSNGLATVPESFLAFAESIAPCASETCDGSPRVIDAQSPSPAFPTFGGVAGGYEVHISEGYAHLDILTAEDDETNDAVGPIVEFLARNTVPEPGAGLLQVAALLGLSALAARAKDQR